MNRDPDISRLWCARQGLEAECEFGKERKVLCLAHLSEDRIFECPYKNAADRASMNHPCADYEPIEGVLW